MGRIVQRKLVRKLDLERFISKIEPHPAPSARLEQYTMPANLAAEILYITAYSHDDIADKTVIDLGCGTGRLALGAAFLGARKVLGIDVDKTAVNVARRNAEKLGLKDKTDWIIEDVDAAFGSFDTVLQNPPFGVQKRGADRSFITKALQLGHSIYSLHKGSKLDERLVRGKTGYKTNPERTPFIFIRNLVERNGGRIVAVYPLRMEIPKTFDFHTERKHKIRVDLFVIEGKAKSPSELCNGENKNAE